jgi:hypothetical protein
VPAPRPAPRPAPASPARRCSQLFPPRPRGWICLDLILLTSLQLWSCWKGRKQRSLQAPPRSEPPATRPLQSALAAPCFPLACAHRVQWTNFAAGSCLSRNPKNVCMLSRLVSALSLITAAGPSLPPSLPPLTAFCGPLRRRTARGRRHAESQGQLSCGSVAGAWPGAGCEVAGSS